MFWKLLKSHLVFELSVIQALRRLLHFYLQFLFSAQDTWFPLQLFPPFVHKYFILTIRHWEKGMPLNCQLVLCSENRYHYSISRLCARNFETDTICTLLEIRGVFFWQVVLEMVQSITLKNRYHFPKYVNI